MSLFFILARDNAQYAAKRYDGKEKHFANIKVGDYAFVSHEPAKVNALWRLRQIVRNGSTVTGLFDEAFKINTPLGFVKFIRLDLFRLTTGLVIFVRKPTGTFPELSLDDPQKFNNVIANGPSFDAYIADPNSYRDIVFANSTSTPSKKDIQIKEDGNSYSILNKNEPFMAELASKFQPQKYQQLCNFLKTHPGIRSYKKKVKDWLDSKGTIGTIEVHDIWDLFCSQQLISRSKKVSGGITPVGLGVGGAQTSSETDPVEEEGSNDVAYGNVPVFKNLIVYGIPGCGKSYRLKTHYLSKAFDDRVIRVTFHPEYSNSDFVGQLRPVKKGSSLGYEVIPGPFLKALELALTEPEKKVALVIEEINRGNASAIFGDLFQLLDRNASGESEYDIENEVISSYLKMKGIRLQKIKIPSNLYLFATMNTSDQNVFKLDTAFKRRWEFERLTNEDTEKDVVDFPVFKVNGNNITWLEFIKAINAKIVENDEISGDRQIGNFFYQDTGINLKRFANKVLEYLYNDVCKYGGKEDIFKTEKYKSFDDIYNAFVRGDNVFRDELFETNPAPASPASGAGTTVAPTATNSANVSTTADTSVKGNDEQ